MRCEGVQEILSANMDGAFVPERERVAADLHLRGCSACRAFVERSSRVRTSIRIRPAEAVPDMTHAIMAAVAVERAHPPRGRHVRTRIGSRRRFAARTSLLAATLAGMIIGSVVVGGPWQRPSNRSIAAATVAEGVRGTARTLEAFRGTYRIVEHGLSPEVPERAFAMDLAFRAPQRFRLDVRDLTEYPSAAWTPTDLTYIEKGAATYESGPPPCPRELPTVCLPTRTTVTRVSPYSAAAPLPADLIVPIATFVSVRGVQVVGRDTIGGRSAIRVEMSFARAAPLFPFLRLGGTWRPFFDRDRVVLWLDDASWSPLRYEVFPSTDPARRAWEMRFGLPVEDPAGSILDVTATTIATTRPASSLFAIPGGLGRTAIPATRVVDRLGYVPAAPSASDGLALVSILAPDTSAPAAPRSVLIYADGLDYLRLAEFPGWRGAEPFGPIDADAEQVAVGPGGIGYYEPAGDGLGGRLAIHATSTDLYLESNLSRRELVGIAASLPVRGRPFPRAWRIELAGSVAIERIPVPAALGSVDLEGLGPRLPDGYVVASASRSSSDGRFLGMTFTIRQRDTDAAGAPVTLHVEERDRLPAISSAEGVRVVVAGVKARWTPARSLLEWVDEGWYRSIQGDLDLAAMLSIATSVTSGTTR